MPQKDYTGLTNTLINAITDQQQQQNTSVRVRAYEQDVIDTMFGLFTSAATTSISAVNGLTWDGTNLLWGGTLTGSTVINGNSNRLTIGGSSELDINASRTILRNLGSLNTQVVQMATGTTIMNLTAGTPTFEMVYDALNNKAEFRDYRGSDAKGIEYLADYSANYSNRSLIDRGYFLANTSGFTTGSTSSPTLLGTQIGFGSTGNTLTGSTGFTYSTNGVNLINGTLAITGNSTNRAFKIMQDSALLEVGSGVGSTGAIRFYANQTAPSATNFNIDLTQADTTFNAPSIAGSIAFQTGNNTRALFNGTQTTGSVIGFSWAKPNNTNQTAGTEIQGWRYLGGTRQWIGGNIPLQRDNWWTPVTFSFTTASTIAYGYGNYYEAPIAGTNAAITNPYAIGTTGDIAINIPETSATTSIGRHVGSSFANAIYILGSATTRTANNYVLRGDQTNVELNSPNAAGYVAFMNGAGSLPLIVRSTGSTAHQIFTIRRSQNSFVTNLNIDSGTGNTSVLQVNTDHTNNHAIIDARNNFNLLFQTNDVTRAALLNNGNLIIGDTANTTNQRLVRINQDSSSIDIGSNSSNPTQAGIWLNQTTPSGGNAALLGVGSSTTYLQATSGIELRPGGSSTMILRPFGGSGSVNNFNLLKPNNTSQTASVEVQGWRYEGGLRGWLGGPITTQRENWWTPTMYSASTTTVITNAYGNFLEQPITGTNVTFTNPFALGLNGNLHFSGNNSVIVMNDSTGSKRDVLSFAGDNVRIAGVPNSSDIYLNVTAANTGVIVKSNGALGIRNSVPTALLDIAGSSASTASMRIRVGTTPSSPNDGEIWFDGTNLYMRISGITRTFTMV